MSGESHVSEDELIQHESVTDFEIPSEDEEGEGEGEGDGDSDADFLFCRPISH